MKLASLWQCCVLGLILISALPTTQADQPTRQEVEQALLQATKFYQSQVSRHGGYVYASSADLTLSEGEGKASDDVIWVQPPGTPLVGEAYLMAWEATGNELFLQAAREAGMALVVGQLHSGGWFYHVQFSEEARQQFAYRMNLKGEPLPNPVRPQDRNSPGGWDVWRQRKYKTNVSTFDDDTTPAALRFLMKLDRAENFQNKTIHQAVEYALDAILSIQYPNGGFSANWDRFQAVSPSAEQYPPLKARYPESWPQTWPKDFTGCYVNNDNLTANMINTLLLAGEIYNEDKYTLAAKQVGQFLILAQMPQPQPAWAQQYNARMEPVWDRAFEPPAISGRESQSIMRSLIQLAERTGEKQYLAPIPAALEYLRKSQLADGRLSRFYELKSNRPIYFTRDQTGRHQPTYDQKNLATNYAFLIESDLDEIEALSQKALSGKPTQTPRKLSPAFAEEVRAILGQLDPRGAWVEQGRLRHHKVEPRGGVIQSQTFSENVRTLCEYLSALQNAS